MLNYSVAELRLISGIFYRTGTDCGGKWSKDVKFSNEKTLDMSAF